MDKPVILITGALTGIGRAHRRRFRPDGARLTHRYSPASCAYWVSSHFRTFETVSS